MDGPPQYENEVFSCSWLGAVLGRGVQKVTHQPLTDSGGMMCYIQRIQVAFSDAAETTFIFKQLVGEDKCKVLPLFLSSHLSDLEEPWADQRSKLLQLRVEQTIQIHPKIILCLWQQGHWRKVPAP